VQHRVDEIVDGREPPDRRGFAARDHEGVHGGQLVEAAHLDPRDPEGGEDRQVFANIPLEGENADLHVRGRGAA
jgi:hypothetical protein